MIEISLIKVSKVYLSSLLIAEHGFQRFFQLPTENKITLSQSVLCNNMYINRITHYFGL